MNVGKWLKIFIAVFIGCWVAMPGTAQTVDYFEANRAMIRNGVQAVLTCNGLFTSERTLDQVFAEDLLIWENVSLVPRRTAITR